MTGSPQSRQPAGNWSEEASGSEAPEVVARESDAPPAPTVPESLEEAGLEKSFVLDLVLKTVYRRGATSGRDLSRSTRLPYPLLDGPLLELQQRHLLEVKDADGHGRKGYVFDLTTEGRNRAREALSSSRYVGAAPVPFQEYVTWVERQSELGTAVSPPAIREALEGLVLDESLLDALGAAVTSGSSLFLHGPPGNGKTALARALLDLFDEPIYLPHAVLVEGGTIVKVHDPLFHEPVEQDAGPESDGGEGEHAIIEPPPAHDQRYNLVHRPVVTAGGELDMDDLDLQKDEQAGVYRAPLQLKANGGVLLIDDFGRQRVPPRELLNRWMVPLEEERDYLTLPTGHKLPVPFDCFLIFATNLEPTDLVEEAFLRRLRYKVAVENPTREQYEEIFRQCCEERGLEYTPAVTELVFEEFYEKNDIEPRGCHPRDLVAHLCDEAQYRGEAPSVTRPAVERACRAYFLPHADSEERAGRGRAQQGKEES